MGANLIYLVDDEANIIDFVRVYLEKKLFSLIAYLGELSSAKDRISVQGRDYRNG